MATDPMNVRIAFDDPSARRSSITPRQQVLLDSFDYHRPSPEQGDRIGRVRAAFKRCALTVIACTPEGADQTAALRQLHEGMMTANKAIACEPGTERLDSFVGVLSEPGPVPGHVETISGIAPDDPNPGV